MPLDFDPTSPDTKWRATGSYLWVRQFQPKQKGAIIVPDTNPLQDNTGEVLSVGPDCKCGANVGDVVLWTVYRGQAAGHYDKTRWVIKDEDVCGIVERGSAA